MVLSVNGSHPYVLKNQRKAGPMREDQPALLSPLDDGVDHGPAVPHDEDPLGAGEDPGEILGVLQG